MRNSAALAHNDHAHELTAFVRELSTLCRKHGVGIGEATLYEMEPEDYKFDYRVDDDSKLVLG